ncbi:hypothetical protein GMDG_07471 [Pseudogymnoascus destructans 20631-21]|uniref:Uncharacterized protein n=1 Tax=Pseudogymnoascus destructans (strain ATCC MYA-4855 / 20631-21) TaxID=658429 RepID=L8G0T4_PSED2|nr:hypothetical protein GMDG_07471 [Pseudogymnoascus destructans 20631-21]
MLAAPSVRRSTLTSTRLNSLSHVSHAHSHTHSLTYTNIHHRHHRHHRHHHSFGDTLISSAFLPHPPHHHHHLPCTLIGSHHTHNTQYGRSICVHHKEKSRQ